MTRLGVLGGGQLAAMLHDAARGRDIEMAIYARSASDPAAHGATALHTGTFDDDDALREFFATLDVVIFENEFLDVERLRRAAEGTAVRFVPSLEVIAEYQDKLTQKRRLDRLAIDTAPWIDLQPSDDVASFLERVTSRWPGGAILKWSRGGYDGKGVLPVDPSAESMAAAAGFLRHAAAAGVAAYAEERIGFVRELAIVATASDERVVTYPLVISEQKRGTCHRVLGPAADQGAEASLETRAREIAHALAGEGLHGSFAIELFETVDGRLLVNEIAPRVHNSGHYSIDASEVSQFANHVRVALGEGPADHGTRGRFAMLNLLGPGDLAAPVEAIVPDEPDVEGVTLHWYRKASIGRMRKMGHINAVARDGSELSTLLDAMHAIEARWHDAVRQRAAAKEKRYVEA